MSATQLDILARYQGPALISLGMSGSSSTSELPMFAVVDATGIKNYGTDVSLAVGDSLAVSQMLILAPEA